MGIHGGAKRHEIVKINGRWIFKSKAHTQQRSGYAHTWFADLQDQCEFMSYNCVTACRDANANANKSTHTNTDTHTNANTNRNANTNIQIVDLII